MADIHVVWLRNDLRLQDHPALHEAGKRNAAILPVFIWAPEESGEWAPGAAGRWWLHHSLRSLKETIEKRGGHLILREGPTAEALYKIAEETHAAAVYYQSAVEPWARKQEAQVSVYLKSNDIPCYALPPDLLVYPGQLLNRNEEPYKVFTPFWKEASSRLSDPLLLPEPDRWSAPPISSLQPEDFGLLPDHPWTKGLAAAWTPGEAGAHRRFEEWLSGAIAEYSVHREIPSLEGTSRLSPHLHFGEISIRAVVKGMVTQLLGLSGESSSGGNAWLRQLYWREFGHYLLWHFPHTPHQSLYTAYADFPWKQDNVAFKAWRRGKTGYPIVDAGMRELWETGWMHNRVRMIVASFLVKDLLIPWQEGARWFWDTLVDADLANNTLGWQWAAGCGADAAPYFRIFNPELQSRKFDPDGAYLRRWLPELAACDCKSIHSPNTTLEHYIYGYPPPIIDHAYARERALQAYQLFRHSR